MGVPAGIAICEDFLAGFCLAGDDCKLLHREVDLEGGEEIPVPGAIGVPAQPDPPVAGLEPENASASPPGMAEEDGYPAGATVDTAADASAARAPSSMGHDPIPMSNGVVPSPVPASAPNDVGTTRESTKLRALCKDFAEGFCILEDKCPLRHDDGPGEYESPPDDLVELNALPDEPLLLSSTTAGQKVEKVTEKFAAMPGMLEKPGSLVVMVSTTVAEGKRKTLHEELEDLPDEPEELSDSDQDDDKHTSQEKEVDAVPDEPEKVSKTEEKEARTARQKEIDELPDEPEEFSESEEYSKETPNSEEVVKKKDEAIKETDETVDKKTDTSADEGMGKALTEADKITPAKRRSPSPTGTAKRSCGAAANDEDEMTPAHTPRAGEEDEITPASSSAGSKPLSSRSSAPRIRFSDSPARESPPPSLGGPPRRGFPYSISRTGDEITPPLPPPSLGGPPRSGFQNRQSGARASFAYNRHGPPRRRFFERAMQVDMAKSKKRSQFFCDVCTRDCQSQSNYDSHIRGKAHKRAALKARMAEANRSPSPPPEVPTVAPLTSGAGAEDLASAWERDFPDAGGAGGAPGGAPAGDVVMTEPAAAPAATTTSSAPVGMDASAAATPAAPAVASAQSGLPSLVPPTTNVGYGSGSNTYRTGAESTQNSGPVPVADAPPPPASMPQSPEPMDFSPASTPPPNRGSGMQVESDISVPGSFPATAPTATMPMAIVGTPIGSRAAPFITSPCTPVPVPAPPSTTSMPSASIGTQLRGAGPRSCTFAQGGAPTPMTNGHPVGTVNGHMAGVVSGHLAGAANGHSGAVNGHATGPANYFSAGPPVLGQTTPWVGTVPHSLPPSLHLSPPLDTATVPVPPGHPNYRGPSMLMPEAELQAGATLLRAGPVSQTQDPDMLAQMTRAHWQELQAWAYGSNPLNALTFKVLQEYLLSPSVGIGSQHLGPLNSALDAHVRHEVYSSGARYSVMDSYPGELSQKPSDLASSKAERDAVAVYWDNLMYMFHRRSVDEADEKGEEVKFGLDKKYFDWQLPLRGTVPNKVGAVVQFKPHAECVATDPSFQKIQQM